MSTNSFLRIPKKVEEEGTELSKKHMKQCSDFNSKLKNEVDSSVNKIESRIRDIRQLTNGVIDDAGLPIAITPAITVEELPTPAPGTGVGPSSSG